MTSAAIQDVRAMRRQLPALTSVLRKRDPPPAVRRGSGTTRSRTGIAAARGRPDLS